LDKSGSEPARKRRLNLALQPRCTNFADPVIKRDFHLLFRLAAGAAEDQTGELVGKLKREDLANHSADRQADKRCARDLQVIEQCRDIGCKLLQRAGVAWGFARAMTAEVVKQNAKPVRKKRKLVSPDFHAGRQRVAQHDRWPAPVAVLRVSEPVTIDHC